MNLDLLDLEIPYRALAIIPRSWHSSGKRIHIVDSDQAGPPFTAMCGCNIRESRKGFSESFPWPPRGCTICLRAYDVKVTVIARKLRHEKIRDMGYAQWLNDLDEDGTIIDGPPAPVPPVPKLPLTEPKMSPIVEKPVSESEMVDDVATEDAQWKSWAEESRRAQRLKMER